MKPPIVLYEPPQRLRTDYRIGLSAWTDKSMLEDGQFYPRKTMTAEERLWRYSQFFDVVEVNSSFYAVPSPDTSKVWVARTPPGFLFNVKAHALLTGHRVDFARLPNSVRRFLPTAMRSKTSGTITNDAVGEDARLAMVAELREALRPLHDGGKLGYVLFQLAPWVKFSDDALRSLEHLREELSDFDVAVEFRNRSWFGKHTDETLQFLNEHALTYVSIDGPRARGAVPSVPALTGPTAVFRLHGRNFHGWLKQVQGKAPTVAEKYDYLYKPAELAEIAGAAGALNGRAERVHITMNNNRGDYPAINGMQLKEMLLEDWRPPDRERLVEALNDRRAPAKHAARRHRAA